MKIETKFDLGDKVEITELKCKGVIKSLFVGMNTGLSYNVRYFDKCEAREIYFYESELEKV